MRRAVQRRTLNLLPDTLSLLAIGFALTVAGCTGSGPGPQPGPGGLPGENRRQAFQSRCAQNVIACTVSFPAAEISVTATGDQAVDVIATGFRVEGSDGDGAELVQLDGSGSARGQGATELFFSWSSAAGDDDPCTLTPGDEFSTAAEPQVLLQEGFHYIRLTVSNDLPSLDTLDAGECGTFENFARSDFIEIEIEVIDD